MSADHDADVEHVEAGQSGHIGDYDVFVAGDTVTIIEDVDGPDPIVRQVDGLDEFVDDADDFRLGWAEFQDGMEVVYLYDKADDYYGYGLNLSSSMLSEWGYAPFR